ncbi:MAG: nicotinate (nicotinamide) nucleotide adenylyltransferase, partial [Pseudomonadota bacterium]
MNKIALFGGTFDPVHLGHTACVQHLVEKMDFSQVVLVPTSQNPLKKNLEPASREDRLKMIELAVADFREEITIDEFEVMKNQPSYSFETLKRYQDSHNPEELFLVMGLDSFQSFDQWKNFSEIIKMTNLLIVSRPPYRRPLGVSELPPGLQPFVNSYERGFALLETGRTIEFVTIKTEDISSSLVRKKLKAGKNINSLLNMDVEKYIKENNVYPQLVPGQTDFLELTQLIGSILNERAMNCAGYDLTGLDKLYDYTLIASATSTKQAQSLANNIKEQVKDELGLAPFNMEGRE